MTLRTLNYGNSGIFPIMGNAGFCPSTVGLEFWDERVERPGIADLQSESPKLSATLTVCLRP